MAAPNPNQPVLNATTRVVELQGYYQQKYHYYRNVISQFTVNHRDRLRNVAVPSRAPFRTARNQIGFEDLERQARNAVTDEYKTAYSLMRSSFRYFQCLGWGGDGIVSLWRYSPGRGQEHDVVMKMSVQWEYVPWSRVKARVVPGEIPKERDMITQLGRSPHIVHRFYTAHHPRANPNPGSMRSTRKSAAVADMADKIDGHQGSWFLMEYCKFGNLEAQLRKAARDMPNNTERYLPESVLWRFFDCLTKACMAMEEPPRLNPANGAVPAPTQGGYLPEVLTPGNVGRQGIAHMDLIGDFGFAQNEANAWAPACLSGQGPATAADYRRREQRWRARDDGKILYALPEQFGKDWDRIPCGQDPSDGQQQPYWMQPWMPAWMQAWAPPPPITTGPGRYSSASNVWQIAMIIKVCMTLMDPDQPPYAGRMASQEPPNSTPDQERWTYGWSLLDPAEPWAAQYQQSLIDLVARCLMAKQEHRPTLQQIQTVITQELTLPANQNVPAYWTNTFFREPRPPKPPEDTEDLSDIDPFRDFRTGRAL
ncbi:hypothetical protein J7T55_015369 [Diaporthe amygdali]|uniref:uncharacterized protein n=1 Tax=Phomopsis amygdali TaxID=1214568 RepID=UPI0022FDD39B|nr:uncharacterized protein J7T55_015369 [Diaporthe amygdali]KAJ0120639.1 hypothetical protein J7T55_015369 [Diaporthe amygdali]